MKHCMTGIIQHVVQDPPRSRYLPVHRRNYGHDKMRDQGVKYAREDQRGKSSGVSSKIILTPSTKVEQDLRV